MGHNHRFDTVKVRLQTLSPEKFEGVLDCILKTVRREGLQGFYKGATPPLLGWVLTDSIMMGSLANYRRLIKDTFYKDCDVLPLAGASAAGVGAGWTVSFVATPIEQIKSRLQIQVKKKYSGPIDCTSQLVQDHGLRALWRGLLPAMLFRTNFLFLWGSYDILTKFFKKTTSLHEFSINFLSGGLASSVFWCFAYPMDAVKQKIMMDDFRAPRRYPTWRATARQIYAQAGIAGFYRGFTAALVRSFPANASGIAVFEFVSTLLS